MNDQYRMWQAQENELYAAQLQAAINLFWKESGLKSSMMNCVFPLGWSESSTTTRMYSGPYSSTSMNHKLHKAKEWLKERGR